MTFSIKDFLNNHKDVIMINQKSTSWKEAIWISIKPLIDYGICTDEYYKSIIDSTEKYGPYYILCPDVAMPHGEIGKGVFQNGISLTVFQNDVEFSLNSKAKIFMTLCAKDNAIHTSIALPQIAALFENQDYIAKILSANSKNEIIDFINFVDLNKYLK